MADVAGLVRFLAAGQVEVAGKAHGHGGAGDVGLFILAGKGHQLPEVHPVEQHLPQRAAVGVVAGLDQGGGDVVLEVVLQCGDQLLTVRLGLFRVRGGRHHQELELGFLLRHPDGLEQVQVEVHRLLQGVAVVFRRGDALAAADVADRGLDLVAVVVVLGDLADQEAGQAVQPGQQGAAPAQLLLDIMQLIVVDVGGVGGVVDADQQVDVVVGGRLQGGDHIVCQLELPHPDAQVVVDDLLGQHGLIVGVAQSVLRQGDAVLGIAVIGKDVLQRQIVPLQGGTSHHAIGPQGVVLLQPEALISHGGRQAHHAVKEVDPVVRVLRQGEDEGVEGLRLAHGGAVVKGQGEFPADGAGVHQPAGEQLVQGQQEQVAALPVHLLDPGHQGLPVAVLGAVAVGLLAVQLRAVGVAFRQDHLVPGGLRQIDHVLHVVGPVVQGNIGDDLIPVPHVLDGGVQRLQRRGDLPRRRQRPDQHHKDSRQHQGCGGDAKLLQHL